MISCAACSEYRMTVSFSFKGECQSDDDCPLEKACIDYYCVNPCLTNSTCRAQDFCQVRNHVPVCGFNQRITQEVRDILTSL